MEMPGSPGPLGAVAERVLSEWTPWAQTHRLHTLATPLGADVALAAQVTGWLLAHFECDEAVSEPFTLHLQVLMLDAPAAHLPLGPTLQHLCGQPLSLRTQLADGSHVLRSGLVTEARALHADGGFALKALTLRPWPALLAHTLHSRIWQGHSAIDIVDDVFSHHPGLAVWRWDEGVAQHVAAGLFAGTAGRRPHCVQHQESDLDFVQRLLAEEGIAWRTEERPDAPAGHGLVLFAHSLTQPQDPTSAEGPGILWHANPGQESQQAQDGIEALARSHRLGHTAQVVLGWDPQAHAATTAEALARPQADAPTDPRAAPAAGPSDAEANLSWLAHHDPTSARPFATPEEVRFAATLLLQAEQARAQSWTGHGQVRSLRAGTWARVTRTGAGGGNGAPIPELFFTRVRAVGINTLPKAPLPEGLAQGLGQDLHALADGHRDGHMGWHMDSHLADLRAQARRTGFACAFQAAPRGLPWRPALADGTGLRLRPRPTVRGPQTALVVGPDGLTQPRGADELHTDAQGRVRVRFHWQAERTDAGGSPAGITARDSCWLRVQQRLAGPGMGHQFIPRIGQEVLVGFLGNDIDHPVVIASLYNGQGESGIAPTPGGAVTPGAASAHSAAQPSALSQSSDHAPASQMNLIGEGAGGHSPAWHGAAPGAAAEGLAGQANAAALSGIKSKEFGGRGHNQLVLDDTPQQLRARLHTTQAQTWLEMGHLLHQADNHRGSLRGQGLELRTDAWGGVRAARGLLLSTCSLCPAGGSGLGTTPDAADDNAAGTALARQMQQLAQAFQQAATAHQTVGLAGGNPHTAGAHIALVGQAGVGLTAGQDVHLSSQGEATLASGQDSHWAVGGQARIHTGQAIGVLAGAIQPGGADAPGHSAAGTGLTLIAAQGPIGLQAQNGPAQVVARQALEIKAAQGMVHVAAARRVVLAVSGGASITLEGGQLTVQCPGKVTVQAGQKSMLGGATQEIAMPILPSTALRHEAGHDQFFVLRWANSGKPMANQPFRIRRANGQLQTGSTDAQGRSPLLDTASKSERLSVEILRAQLTA